MLTKAGALFLVPAAPSEFGKCFIEMFRFPEGATEYDHRSVFDGTPAQQVDAATRKIDEQLGFDTSANLRDAHAARNRRVIQALRAFNLAEDAGRGIRVILDEMAADLRSEPTFAEEIEGHVTRGSRWPGPNCVRSSSPWRLMSQSQTQSSATGWACRGMRLYGCLGTTTSSVAVPKIHL